MTVTREDVVAEARRWLGTPFHHQGRLRGVGVDCAGLVIEVGRALGLGEVAIGGYPHLPAPEFVAGHVAALLDRVEGAARPGDVLLLGGVPVGPRVPQHLAIATPVGMIHAYGRARRVVEHRIDDAWAARVLGAFSYRGIER